MKTKLIAMRCLLIGTFAITSFSGCTKKVETPAVVGLELTAATDKLKELGLALGKVSAETGGQENAPGSVLRQEPAAGQKLAPGATVHLTVDNTMILPSFVGYDLTAATTLAESRGVRIGAVVKEPSNSASEGSVVAQNPSADSRIVTNTVIQLIVASAPVRGGKGNTSEARTEGGFVDTTEKAVEKGKSLVDDVGGIIGKARELFGSSKDRKKNGDDKPATPPRDEISGSRSTITSVSMDPRSPASITDKQRIKVNFHYVSGEPEGISVTVVPLLSGQPVRGLAGTFNRRFTATAGDGSIEFNLTRTVTAIDEIRLEVRSLRDPARVLYERQEAVQYRFNNATPTVTVNKLPLVNTKKIEGINFR